LVSLFGEEGGGDVEPEHPGNILPAAKAAPVPTTTLLKVLLLTMVLKLAPFRDFDI
jgi:hypothetical protein